MEARVASLHELRAALNAEHEHLWRLVDAVRGAPKDDRGIELSRLVRYLAVHEAAEEVVIHNAWVDETTRERLDEERRAAEMVERLIQAADPPETAVAEPRETPTVDLPDTASTDPRESVSTDPRETASADGSFSDLLDELEQELRDHAEAEENEELPVIATELEPEDLGEMLRVLIMVRELAEDVATPIADGSFAAMRLAAQREFRAATNQLR